MSTTSTPAFPEPTINNTAEEIKAALEAPTPEPTVTAQPPQAEWGQLVKNPDNTYQVTLSTGEVFKGTADEVIAKQAEAQYNTKRWGQEWKQKFEGVQPQTPEPPQPPPNALTPEEQQVIDWQDGLEAKRRGLSVDQYRAQRAQEEAARVYTYNEAQKASFFAENPTYAPTDENGKVMEEYVLNLFPQYKGQERFPTAYELKQAFAMAVIDGKIKPITPTPQTSAVPNPPVMPSSGAATGMGEPNPWAMPMSELKKLL